MDFGIKKNFTAKIPNTIYHIPNTKYQIPNDKLSEKNAINIIAVADLYCCLQREARQEIVQNCFYEQKKSLRFKYYSLWAC